MSGEEFFISQRDLNFYESISPVIDGKKYTIPTPTISPIERSRRRLSFRNERSLYKRKCDLTGKNIVSSYSGDKDVLVYDIADWESDDWDRYSFFCNPDFELPFFDQFADLKKRFPHPSLHVVGTENCDFVNQCGYSKDCYLTYNTDYSEHCLYSSSLIRSKDCIDCYN